MATRPKRPDSDIQGLDGKITPRWMAYFQSLEDAVFRPAALGNYANDAAAAAGGVPLYGLYANAGAVRQRIV